MTPSPLLIRALFALSVAFAWALTRRAPQHRPAAVALSALLAVDLARPVLRGTIPPLADGALFLAVYAIQAALALRVVVGRRAPMAALAGWTLATVALAAWWSPRVEVIAFAASLATQVIAVAAYARRRPRELPSTQHGVAILFAISAAADVLGPWLAGQPRRDWSNGAWTAVLTWAMICGWEVWRWVVLSPRRSL